MSKIQYLISFIQNSKKEGPNPKGYSYIGPAGFHLFQGHHSTLFSLWEQFQDNT